MRINLHQVRAREDGQKSDDLSKFKIAKANAMLVKQTCSQCHAPALESRHTRGCQWYGELSIADAKGNIVKIKSSPRSGLSPELHAVGSTYSFIKFNKRGRDDPHWSDTGA